MEIKVLFANVCQSLLYRGKDTKNIAQFAGCDPKRYANSLATFNPDLLLCAEMLMDDDSGGSSMAETFSKTMNLPYTQNHVVGECWDKPVKDKFYGLSLLSRYPIAQYEITPLPNPKLEALQPDGQYWVMHDKAVQKATIALPDGNALRCFNLHAFPFHKFGRSMAEPAFTDWRQKFSEMLIPKAGEKLICGGDFNNVDVPVETILATAFTDGRLKNAVLKNEAKEIRTTSNSHADDYKKITIDHILCSPDFLVKEPAVIYGDSDHPTLMATLSYA